MRNKYKYKIIIIIISLLLIFLMISIFKKDTLIWAISNNKYYIVEIFIKCGTDINEKLNIEPYKTHYIFYANSLNMYDLLLSSGADINAITRFHGSRNLLINAIDDKNYKLLDLLLSKGAKLTGNNTTYFDPELDAIYNAAVIQCDPIALANILEYSYNIKNEKMVIYLSDIYNININTNKLDKNKIKSCIECSEILLSTMFPNERNEMLKLMVDNNLLTNEWRKSIIEMSSDPVYKLSEVLKPR